jgi:hypothetical protein
MKWLRFPRILGVAVCLYLLGMAALFGFLSTASFRFVNNATATEGTVVSLVVKRPAGSQRDPNLRSPNVPLAPKVTYEVNGKTYSYVAAHGRYHQRLTVGSKVTVLYDPSDPAQARLQGEGRVLIPLITSGFATAAIGLGVLLFLTRNGLHPAKLPAEPAPTEDTDSEQDDHGT